MFADDTATTVSRRKFYDLLVNVRKIDREFSSWCEQNPLILNAFKSVPMKFFNGDKISGNTFG